MRPLQASVGARPFRPRPGWTVSQVIARYTEVRPARRHAAEPVRHNHISCGAREAGRRPSTGSYPPAELRRISLIVTLLFGGVVSGPAYDRLLPSAVRRLRARLACDAAPP